MKAPGKTTRVSISVDEETIRFLKAEAKRNHSGSVSALVTALARDAKRQAAFDWLIRRAGSPAVTSGQLQSLLAEIDGKPPPKKRSRRAA